MDLRTSGTSTSNVENGLLLSLMHPVQDFFKSVIIFRTPGIKKFVCMCEMIWRTSRPWPRSLCTSLTMHLARIVVLQMSGMPTRERKLLSET